jgi:bacterioferritin
MKGHTEIIDGLNSLLCLELTAMDQYFIHSEMYADWGLYKLHERIAHESDDEKGHAKAIIERILFLGGKPDMVARNPLQIGETVADMLKSDLNVEYMVGARLKEVMALCESHSDFVTRNILQQNLEDTEVDHTWWLEKQLGLINKIGLQNYVQSQLGESPEG